jgi:hypothetical protein
MKEDSIGVYNFLIDECLLKPKNILVLGRSIGSGPATYLAANKKVGALILVSAFSSIRNIVSDFV